MSLFQDEFSLAFQCGQYQRALAIAESALEQYPTSAHWTTRIGLVAQKMGHFDDALRRFDEAISLDPTYVEALLNGAVLLAQLGFYDEASGRLEAAKALDVQNAKGEEKNNPTKTFSLKQKTTQFVLGVVEEFCGLQEWDKAKTELERALAVLEEPTLRLRLAQVLLRVGETSAAQRELSKLSTEFEDNVEYLQTVAQCWLSLKKQEEAAHSLLKLKHLGDKSRATQLMTHMNLQ